MPSSAGREGHTGGFPPCPSFRDVKVGQRHPRVPTLWSRMRKGTGTHRHPPVYRAPPAELPRGRADTSDRKLPPCDTETAAGLLEDCSFTPSPGLHGPTRTPGPAPAAPRGSLPSPAGPEERPAPGTAPPREGAAGAPPALSLPGGATASFPRPARWERSGRDTCAAPRPLPGQPAGGRAGSSLPALLPTPAAFC